MVQIKSGLTDKSISHFCYFLTLGLVLSLASSAMAADPSPSLQLYQQYKAYRDAGDFANAETALKTIVSDYSASEEALGAQGLLVMHYIKAGKDSDAQTEYSKLLTMGAGDLRLEGILKSIAGHYERAGNSEKAATCLNDSIAARPTAQDYANAEAELVAFVTNNPNNSEALVSQKKLILLYIEQSKFTEAQSAYNQLLTMGANDSRLREFTVNIAHNFRKTGQLEKSQSICKYVVSNWPTADNSSVFKLLISIAYELIKADQLLQVKDISQYVIDNWSEADNSVAVKYLKDIALKYEKAGQPQKAQEICQYIVDKQLVNESAIDAYIKLVERKQELYDYQGADVVCDQILSRFSSHPKWAKAMFRLGQSYSKSENYTKAFELYNNAVGLTADDNEREKLFKAIYHAGYGSQKKKDYTIARKAYKTLLQDFPANERKLSIIRNVTTTSIHLNDPNSVQETTTQFIKIVDDPVQRAQLPDSIDVAKEAFFVLEAYSQQAYSSLATGDTDNANKCFNKVIEFGKLIEGLPMSKSAWVAPEAMYMVAECYRQQGKYEIAVENLKSLTEKWPSNPVSAQACFLAVECYKKMEHSRQMSEADSKVAITQAYQSIVENFPETDIAARAVSKLSEITSN